MINNIEKHYTVEVSDALPCALIAFTDDGAIRFVNARLADMLQCDREELQHQHIETIFTLPARIFYQTHLFPLLQLKNSIEEISVSLKARNGDVPVLAYAHKAQWEGAEMNVCVFVHVSQRVKYEEEILRARQQGEKLSEENTELVQVKQALELYTRQLDRQVVRLTQVNDDYKQLSKVISHDLREPIRKIGVFTDILRRSLIDDGKSESRYFEKIASLVQRLKELTQCIEQFVSIDVRKEEPLKISLHETLMAANTRIRDEMKFEHFALEVEALPEVEGYPSQIKQLFYELIRNSVQYRDQNRELKISVRAIVVQYNQYSLESGQYEYVDFARVEFADNSIGFDNLYAQYVFEMFTRLRFDTTRPGFGLALCKKIAEKHFGSISCNSVPGEGTVFTILLPMQLKGSFRN